MMFLLAGVLALVGCGKPKAPPPPTVEGVALDIPKLREAFASATPELQGGAMDVASSVRYGEYDRALAALAKLANAPGLTEAQKTIVSQVTEQVKQVAAKKAAAPPAR